MDGHCFKDFGALKGVLINTVYYSDVISENSHEYKSVLTVTSPVPYMTKQEKYASATKQ